MSTDANGAEPIIDHKKDNILDDKADSEPKDSEKKDDDEKTKDEQTCTKPIDAEKSQEDSGQKLEDLKEGKLEESKKSKENEPKNENEEQKIENVEFNGPKEDERVNNSKGETKDTKQGEDEKIQPGKGVLKSISLLFDPKFLKNKVLTISVIGVAFLVLSFGISLFRKQKVFIYDNPIPFIWNEKLKTTFDTFFHSGLHDQFLLLFGPSKFGKTRMIREMISGRDRLSFLFDFRILSTSCTVKDIRKLIQSQIESSILSFDFPTNANFDSIIPSIVALSFLHNSKREHSVDSTKSQLISSLIGQIASLIETSPTLSFNTLFEAIDLLSPFKAAIYITHPDNLANNHNSNVTNIYKILMKSIAGFSLNARPTPIITEISDQNHICKDLLKKDNVRPCYVGEFTLNEARNTLLSKNVFNKKEISAIYSVFGGNGYAFSRVQDVARSGVDISEAIKIVSKSEAFRISTFLSGKDRLEQIQYLKELSRKQELPAMKAPKYLLKSGIITLTPDAKHVVFPSKFYKKAFDTLFPK